MHCCNILLSAGTVEPQTQGKDLPGQVPVSQYTHPIKVPCDPEPIQPEVSITL